MIVETLLSTGLEEAVSNSDSSSVLMWIIFFLGFTLVVGIVAVIAGVGGGVLFTPILMGFTDLNPDLIRGAGLFIAMGGALVAARPFLRRGLANVRLLMAAGAIYALFAVIGATTRLPGGPALNLSLGALMLLIAVIFLAGKRVEYPQVKKGDALSEKLRLGMSYYEESLGRSVDYKVVRSPFGLVLFAGIGFVSGAFGLGAGWAMIPVFNLMMLAPLKVAAACSKIMIGIGDTAGIWVYLVEGAVLPIIAVPGLIGIIAGTLIGTKIMVKVKASYVKYIIIAIMLFNGVWLILKGLGVA